MNNRGPAMAMNELAIAALEDFQDGDHRIFAVDDFEIGVFRIGDRIVAYENVCPHAGGPVCQGKIFNQIEEALTPDKEGAGLRFSKRRNVGCPWHGYEYDLETGCHPGDPRMRLTAVPVEVRGGRIYVGVPATI